MAILPILPQIDNLVSNSPPNSKLLYCRCAFAQVVPNDVKNEVLEQLCESGTSFESVSDLCEMSARNDPRLTDLMDGDEPLQIVACHRRAVKWLFHSAEAKWSESDEERIEVLNMREESADEICGKVIDQ